MCLAVYNMYTRRAFIVLICMDCIFKRINGEARENVLKKQNKIFKGGSKMKRVLSLLLVVLCAVGFASCALGQEETPHVHTFAETWTSDASGHWYAATCDCADVTETKLSHADKNNDGACDVCEYKMACADGHTYAEEWTIDCTNHWHAADCGHIVAGADVAAHTDGDDDGKCDVCNYVTKDIHIHYYDDAWTYDAESHWHAALCEHGVEVAGKEAHNVNAAGFCTVCDAKVKEVDKASIEEILNAAIANNDKVVSGNVAFDELEYSGAGDAMFLEGSSEEVIYFVLGNGTAYHFWKTFQEGNFYGADENWYELVGEDEVFGISKVFGDYQLVPVAGTLEHLNGYTYHPGSILPSTSVDTSTLADTLAALYALKLDGTRVANATENYNSATGVYTFAFTYHTVNRIEGSDGVQYNVEAFDVEVRFTVDEYYVIDQCDFKVAVYHNIEGLDEDLVYDVENDTYTLTAGANPSVFSYSVSQISGERNFINPFPKESLIPTDFDIYSADVEMREDEDGVAYYHVNYGAPIVDSITATENSPLYIAFKNPIPVTGSFAFIDLADLEITAVNKTAGANGVLFEGSEFNPSYSKDNGYLYIFVKDVGTYTLTIKYLDVVKSFDVVVEEAQSGPVGPVEDNEIAVETTDTYVYADEYTFVASRGEGKYTFTLPAFLGIQSKASQDANKDPEFDVLGVTVNNPQYGQPVSVVFELEADEEFVFYVGATTKGSWIISYEYEACEVDGGNQGGSGESNYDTVIVVGANTLYFSADESAADAAERKAVISAAGTYQFQAGNLFIASIVAADGTVITRNADYSFDLEAGEYTVNFSMLSMFGVQADVAYELNVTDVNAEEEEDPIDPDPTLPVLTVGTNNVTLDAEEALAGKMYSFVVTEEGTYTFVGDLLAIVSDSTGLQIGRGSVYLAAGNYTVTLVNIAEEAGDFVVTVNFQAPAGGGSDGSGTETDPYVMNGFPESITFESDTNNKVYYIFTATATGNVTFTWPTADSWWGWTELDASGNNTANSESGYETESFILGVTEGTSYSVFFGTWMDSGEVTITVSFSEGENGGGSGDGEDEGIVSSGFLYEGTDNTVTVTEENLSAGKIYYTFTPWNAGEWYFSSNDLYISAILNDQGVALERDDNYKYDLEADVNYYVEITLSGFVSDAGDYAVAVEYSYPEGHQNNPFWYTLGENATANYIDDHVWYQFDANATGTLTVTNLSNVEKAVIMITRVLGGDPVSSLGYDADWNPVYASTVSLSVIAGQQYYIGFYNAAYEAAEIEFVASIEEGEIESDGSINVPHNIVLGDNTANITDYNSVYFMYKLDAAGTLTFTTDSTNCYWFVSADLSQYVPSVENLPLTFHGYMDDVVYLVVNTIEGAEGEIDFKVSFEADPVEVYYEDVVLTDGTANNIVVEENTWVALSFNGNGNFFISWNNTAAKVELVSWGAPNTPIANGDTVTGSMWGTNLIIYFDNYAAGDVNLTITPASAPAPDFVIGDNSILVTDTWNGNEANFTAPEANTYSFTAGENGVFIYDYTNYFAGESFKVTLAAGETISFFVATADSSESYVDIKIEIFVDSAPASIEGEYRYVDPESWQHRWQIVFAADGTGTIKQQNYDSSSFSWSAAVESAFTYTYADGIVTIDFADGAQAQDGSYTVTSDMVCAVVLNGTATDFTFYE